MIVATLTLMLSVRKRKKIAIHELCVLWSTTQLAVVVVRAELLVQVLTCTRL